MSVAAILLGLISAYLMCSIPFGLLVARLFGAEDIRAQGSGNIGSTNVARCLGPLAGIATLILDAGKGIAGFYLAETCILATSSDILTVSHSLILKATLVVVCVAGHIYSLFLKGKGGKGIATGFGASLAFNPWMALCMAAVFAGVFIGSRQVSRASCIAAASPALFVGLYYGRLDVAGIMLIASGLVLWAHRANIHRLIEGREPRFTFAKAKVKSSNECMSGENHE